MPLGMELGLGPGDNVLDADPAPSRKEYSPQFSSDVYCGQTAGWKMPLSTETDLGPGHIVLDGDPAHPRKGHSSLFGVCLLWSRSPISSAAELLFWPPCIADADIMFLSCGFCLSLFLFFLA